MPEKKHPRLFTSEELAAHWGLPIIAIHQLADDGWLPIAGKNHVSSYAVDELENMGMPEMWRRHYAATGFTTPETHQSQSGIQEGGAMA